MKHRSLRFVTALLAVFALVAAACGDDDDEAADSASDTTQPADEEPVDEEPAGGDGSAEPVDFKACEVTDIGGVDDNSFNETAYAGLTRAESELGVEIAFLESTSEADFEPNIQALLDQDCDLVLTIGFLLGDATEAAADDNPDTDFAIVDFAYEAAPDNLRQLTFATDEAAFLAGYLAAGMTETGTVGTYGGIKLPSVTIFMTGFEAGIALYNERNGTDVELEGWSTEDDDGLFTGDFEDQTKGRATTDQLLDAGADIIMPVAGPVGQGSIEALRADGGDAKLIWVDTDGCVSVPADCDLFLTSVQKKMDVAVFDTIESAVNGDFEGGLYSGTLENDGVDIAPFHDFEDEVPDELAGELDELREQIIDGELEVTLG